MCVAGLFGSRLACEHADERKFALRQAVESRNDVFERVEVVHAIRAAPKFSGSLGPAQEQDADNGDLAPIEIEGFLQPMLELGNATVSTAGRTGKTLFLKTGQGFADSTFIQIHYRITIVLLIARIQQRIQRQRIIIRRCDVFFNQRAEHASFDFGEVHED